jgi:LysM repeat protein
MEGGYLPWKNQKLENNCPSIDYFTKSLSAPPAGQFWERDNEGNWTLVKLADKTKEDGSVTFSQPSVVEHTIMPIDTLPGLCLQYHTTATDIRRMNMFSGNNIQVKTKLLIPINAGVAFIPQIETNEIILQKFKNVTGENTQEARLYLEESNWVLEKAMEAWKNDTQWEKDPEHHPGANFSKEIAPEVVAPFAVEEVPMVTAAEVSYTAPTDDMMGGTAHSPHGGRGFGIFRPLLRPLVGRR